MIHSNSALYDIFDETVKSCGYIDGNLRQDQILRFSDAAGTPERMQVAEAAFEKGFGFQGTSTLFNSACAHCNACKPLRYPVDAFKPSKSIRALKKLLPMPNVSMTYGYLSPEHFQEHLAISSAYFAERFPEDHKILPPEQRMIAPFYLNSKLPITVMDVRTWDGVLVGASINAETENSYMGIYYYYDPKLMHLEPGKQIVVQLIEEARRVGKDHVYVGPWIAGNKSLGGKTLFRPYELYIQGQWQRFDTPQPQISG